MSRPKEKCASEPQGPVSFEESVKQLAKIVEQLESGDLPLDQSIELFERGMLLAKRSQAQLDQAEKRVEELLAVEPDGTPVTRPFDDEGETF